MDGDSYKLYPPFFGVEPQTSFDEAWEVFCCELLKLEYNTHLIQRRTPHDLGADLIWAEKKIIYQCKSSIDGQYGSFKTDKAVRSIDRALENQERIGWQKYVLCTNVDLTGEAWAKLQAKLPEIEILSGGYWIDLCKKFHQKAEVKTRFRYLSHAFPESIRNIPSYLRNPLFTGREEVLEQIHKNFNTGILTQAIHGLGGIGKTQCAVEYARHHRDEYRYILWVNASSHETITKSYTEIAALLKLVEQDEPEQDRIVAVVKQWLCAYSNWLLIADNAEDLKVTFDFLPTTDTGHILFTTREPAVGRYAQSVEVKKMEEGEGILMLLRRAELLAHDAPIEQAEPQDREQARMIVRELDGLPLALDQAGAYIKENQSSLEQYLETYKSRQMDLLKRRGRLGSDHPDSVATTWSLNFEQVARNSPLAADVMRVCAFLASDDIPDDIFVKGATRLGYLLKTLSHDPTLLQEAVGELGHFSLVKHSPIKRTLSIHRLVQVVVKSSLKKKGQRIWAKRVISVLKEIFPSSSDIASWEVCQKYLPHALVCFELIQQYNVTSIEAALLLQNVANYQFVRASYDTVEQMYEHALIIIENHHPHHNTLAHILYDFARFYFAQEVYEEAELLLQRVQTINELDTNEINMARYYNLLAACYYQQENFEEAEELFKLALVICEQSVGPYHPDTAKSLNNLAVLYYAQIELVPEKYESEEDEPGKKELAEILYQRAFFIHVYSLGLNHPETAMSLNNMAVFYYLKKDYEEAEILLQQALTIYEQSLGSDHPDTAISLYNLAKLYMVQKRYEQAEARYQQALTICKHTLGPQHPSTVFVRNNYKFWQPLMLTQISGSS